MKKVAIRLMLVSVFLLSNVNLIFAQNLTGLDSIIHTLDTVPNDSIRMKLYSNEGMNYCYKYPNQSLNWINKGLELAQAQKNKHTEGSCYRYLGTVYRLLGDMDESLANIRKALKIFEEEKDEESIALCYLGIGNTFGNYGDYEVSIQYLKKALQIFNDLKQEKDIAMVCGNLVNCYSMLEKPDTASYYFQISKEINERLGNDRGIGMAHVVISQSYKKQKDFQKALDHLNSSLPYLESNEYISLEDVEIEIGICLAELGRYDEGLKYLHASEKVYLENNTLSGQVIIYKALARAYSLAGDLKMANEYLQKQIDSTKLLHNEDTMKAMQELKEEYEAEKREEENASLIQANHLKALELEKKNYVIIGLMTLMLLIIAIGFVIFYKRQLQSIQKKAELEHKALRAQLNPHFIFNCMNSIQSFIISNDASSASIYLSKFAMLIRKVLEYSREKTVLLEDEIKILNNYVELEKLRFSSKIDFKIEVDASIDVSKTEVPPMVLQPFIENALIHGIQNDQDGVIKLVIRQHKESLECEVIDNGIGGEKESSFKNGKTKSLGKLIIEERLEFLRIQGYKDSKLEINETYNENEKYVGTKVKLSLPLMVA